MIENLLISGLMIVACIAIQVLVVSHSLSFLARLETRGLFLATTLRSFIALSVVLLIALACHLFQIALWAGAFRALGEFEDFATAFYHSAVNFTTIGYGDIVMSDQRRLLGAMEAVNGVLMLGLTTGFVFSVMQALMRREWSQRSGGRRGPHAPEAP